jgi:chaperonin GroEL
MPYAIAINIVFRPNVDDELCFVLMPFGDPFDGYYEHIMKPAATLCGMKALRADEIYGNRAIIRDIWDAIWRARLVVADVTNRNPNVNYELGMCHTLDVPTILIAKRIEDVPFDYRHRRCILYNTEEARWEVKLTDALQKAITAVLVSPVDDPELRWPYEPRPIEKYRSMVTTLNVKESRRVLLEGCAEVTRLVSRAYGPRGTTVSVSGATGGLASLRSGLSIAAGVQSPNPIEEDGIKQLRKVAHQLQESVGDFTKTGVILANALMQRGHDALVKGADSVGLLRGMDAAIETALSTLRVHSKPVCGNDISKLSYTASRDRSIAEMVVASLKGAGKHGIVTIDSALGAELSLSVLDGMRFDRGYLSPNFINRSQTQECVLEDCRILLWDRQVNSMKEVLPILEQVARANVSLLIIAEDVGGEALATLAINTKRGTIRAAAVRAPYSAELRAAFLEDTAVMTGTTYVRGDLGPRLEDVRLKDLGRAAKVVITNESTTIYEGAGQPKTIAERIEVLTREISRHEASPALAHLQRRLTNLGGQIAVIRVGGTAPPDVDDQEYRVRSAVRTAYSSLAEGRLYGGGTALLYAAEAIQTIPWNSDAEASGGNAVRAALIEPLSVLATSANRNPEDVISDVLNRSVKTVGFNVETDSYEDIETTGVLDSTHAIRTAVRVAYSYAKGVLATDAWALTATNSA